MSIFDAAQAAKIQARWDCFDAQQAMTVWCVVEGYNSGDIPQPDLAKATLEAWWANRNDQLRVLRGGVKTIDAFPEVVNGKSVIVTTKLNCLPPDTLYSKATGKLWMLTPYGPLNTAEDYGQFINGSYAWLLRPDSAVAQDLDTSELASFIGKGLASGVLGSIGTMAFGKIMGAMGVDLSGQGEMLKKLDQILAKLDTLQNSVNAMQNYLQAELSQMQYNQAYNAVAKLVATNLTIFRMLKSLLKVDANANPAQVRDLKAKIQALVQDSDYQTGPQIWHDALVGANGQTSLLRAWA
jgi:hypothetical protein